MDESGRTGEQHPFSGSGSADESPRVEASQGSLPYDVWETEEQLLHMGRRLQRGRRPNGARPQRRQRMDGVHAGLAVGPHKMAVSKGRPRPSASGSDPLRLPIWAMLTLGVMLLVCGGTLLGWSVVAGRPELWSIGLPVAIGGQVALLVGLVLQLDRLWCHNRHTADKLDTVDRQVRDLRHTTSMLGTTHSTPAASFYAHFAGGAHPQLLLTDLKSQLDLLAVKIGEHE